MDSLNEFIFQEINNIIHDSMYILALIMVVGLSLQYLQQIS